MDPHPWTLPERRRFNDVVLTRCETLKKSVSAFGLLACPPDNATHKNKLRIVAAMSIGEDGLQRIPLAKL